MARVLPTEYTTKGGVEGLSRNVRTTRFHPNSVVVEDTKPAARRLMPLLGKTLPYAVEES